MKTERQRQVRESRLLDPKFPELAALRGKRIRYWGQTWTAIGPNFLGDISVIRTEQRRDGSYLIGSSCVLGLPRNHPHFAELLSPDPA